ncbi:MAG: thiamine diphosphokinase [Lachnospiraceae bacterium]|nr:thiamine diphosphokinase [Lachnospiraceae bacterium]
MSRAVIICGSKIKDYEFVSSYFKEDDFFIYCDSGLMHEDRFLSRVDTSADLIVGDFDSHENPNRNVETIVLPTEKDDTDSVFAVKEAIKRGFTEMLLVGALGDRLDHGLVNVYVLMYLYDRNIKATIVDDFSEVCLIGNNKGYVTDNWPFFSLVAIAGEAKGVTIENAKYLLNDAVISPSYQYAVSNEPLKGKTAEISVKEGYLLLIKDRY